jgi:integrase
MSLPFPRALGASRPRANSGSPAFPCHRAWHEKPTECGGPLSVGAMPYIVREAGAAAGLGDAIHPHMLRRGAGYALINDAVDVRLVQEFLGHASITARPSTRRYR